ncbi:MAG: methyltransferase [Erysipelotrichaceae bacterium]|nr:methyltransferase [Erysipelotrichaceae bacterium]
MELQLDYLPGTKIGLYQRKDMFRVNTDTCLLGAFIDMNEGLTVMDIGCNNGALMLYAKRFKPHRLIGVDILPEACELAQMNMIYNQITDYEIICHDFATLEYEPVDVLITNPPYDRFNLLPDPAKKLVRVARSEDNLQLDDLIRRARCLLKDNGHFFMIHRASRLNDIIFLLRFNGFSADRLEFVYEKDQINARMVLVSAVKAPNTQCRITKKKAGA